MRDSIFISYSHQDRKFLNELQTMLKSFQRLGTVNVWDDTQIQPGDQWREEIQKALAKAKAAVLLVSTNFLASDFIAQNELPPLLEAAKKDGLRVFWVCLDNCPHEKTEIVDYQAVHDLSKLVSDLKPNQRKAIWKNLCQRLEGLEQARQLHPR